MAAWGFLGYCARGGDYGRGLIRRVGRGFRIGKFEFRSHAPGTSTKSACDQKSRIFRCRSRVERPSVTYDPSFSQFALDGLSVFEYLVQES